MKPISFHVMKTRSEHHQHFHSKQAQWGTACEQQKIFRMHYISEEKVYLVHILIKSSTQHQTWKSKCWEKKKKSRVVLVRQKKGLLPQNRKLPLEWKFMIFLFCIYFNYWPLQLPWQEMILLLDILFFLIINAIPLDTPSLSLEAQTQGTQIAA